MINSCNDSFIINSHDRIIDRLDFQLLLAIFAVFLSAWVFLKDSICNFTASVSTATQLVNIVIHYILTLYMILCLYICSVKGRYVFDKEKDVPEEIVKYFNLFMKTWASTLLISFALLVTSHISFLPWVILIISFIILGWYMLQQLHFSKLKTFILILAIISCFPIFVSFMTMLIRPISFTTDNHLYAINEDVIIYTNGTGYACEYYPISLDETYLYPGSTYSIQNNTIILPANSIKNGQLSIGMSGPITNLTTFITYPFSKILNKYNPSIFRIPEQGNYFYRLNINVMP